jgi:hypothetical protein
LTSTFNLLIELYSRKQAIAFIFWCETSHIARMLIRSFGFNRFKFDWMSLNNLIKSDKNRVSDTCDFSFHLTALFASALFPSQRNINCCSWTSSNSHISDDKLGIIETFGFHCFYYELTRQKYYVFTESISMSTSTSFYELQLIMINETWFNHLVCFLIGLFVRTWDL